MKWLLVIVFVFNGQVVTGTWDDENGDPMYFDSMIDCFHAWETLNDEMLRQSTSEKSNYEIVCIKEKIDG